MLEDTVINRLSVRSLIFVLQWIGPLCTGYTAYCTLHSWPEWPFATGWRIYCAAEVVWYITMIWYVWHLQQEAKHPAKRSPEERRALFAKVLAEIHDPVTFLRGWFKGGTVDTIGKDELRSFLSWAFWNDEANEKDQEEIGEYVHKLEGLVGKRFRDGPGKARSLRLTIDPVKVEARSLIWYLFIMVVDALSFVLIYSKGFEYHRTSMTSLSVFPPRPAAIAATATSVSKQMSYWLRPHQSKTRLPVLFIHGIGLGLVSMAATLHELDQALNNGHDHDDQVGIIALEVLQISSRLTHSIPSRDEFRAEVLTILDHYGWDRFVLVCHSYGSILSSHILTDDYLSSRVSAALMVDPVTVLLHMPDVAYNFTVRPPVRAMEWLLWYFASTDPLVAYTLGRHLFWSETVLWRDRITELMGKGTKFTFSLASEDLIVETKAVGKYLAEGIAPDPALVEEGPEGRQRMDLITPGKNDKWKTRKWSGTGLDIIWWQGYDHADCFAKKPDRAKLIDVVVEYCRGS